MKIVNLSTSAARRGLMYAHDNAVNIARKNAEGYIALNPGDEQRTRRDLAIEICGINNMYYCMVEQLEHVEKINGMEV